MKQLEAADKIANEDIPDLLDHCRRIYSLVRSSFPLIHCNRSDAIELMLVSYLTKQEYHTRSVILLVEQGQHRDALMIARIALEGMAQLLWSLQESSERPKRWQQYSWVGEHKRSLAFEKLGIETWIERKEAIKEGLKRTESSFIQKNHLKKHKLGHKLPADPYVWEWPSESTGKIFAAVRETKLYESVYSSASSWGHWSISEMIEGMDFQESKTVFSFSSPVIAASALAVTFQALIQTFEQVVKHFGLGTSISIGTELAKIREEHEARFSNTASRIKLASQQPS